MRWVLFWYCLYTDPVEVYPCSHRAPLPAKILSRLGNFTERSCFVTQGGKRMVKKPTLRCLLSVLFLLPFPSFHPCMACQIHSLRAHRLHACGWLWIPLSLLSLAFISHLSFMIPSIIETSHPPLLPALPKPKPSPGPGTPAPTTGVELCMVGSSETKDSPQPRPWPT